ncbi:cyclic nucleotide-binding domain-containing protein, partial [archaeon]
TAASRLPAPAVGTAFATSPAIELLDARCGGCHLLVLSRTALAHALGAEWLLRRKRSLLTDVFGTSFNSDPETVWTAARSAAVFSRVSASMASNPVVQSMTTSDPAVRSIESIGASSPVNLSLLATTSHALSVLLLFLQDTPYFSNLEGSALEELAQHFVLLRKRAHTVLTVEGAQSDAFMIVVHGSLRLTSKGNLLMTPGVGYYLGEVSLLHDSPSVATIVTSSDSLLLAMPRAAWDRFLRRHPEVRASLTDRLPSINKAAADWRALRVFGGMSDSQLGCVGLSTRLVHRTCQPPPPVAREWCFFVPNSCQLVLLHTRFSSSLCVRVCVHPCSARGREPVADSSPHRWLLRCVARHAADTHRKQ